MPKTIHNHGIEIVGMKVGKFVQNTFKTLFLFSGSFLISLSILLYLNIENSIWLNLKNDILYMIKMVLENFEPGYFTEQPLINFYSYNFDKINFSFYLSFAIASIFTAFMWGIFFKYSTDFSVEKYVRGSKFSSHKSLTNKLRKDAIFGSKNGYEIGKKKVFVPEEFNWLGYLICGRPGTGKSNLIRHFLEQDRLCGNKAFVVDLDGEYWRTFGRPGKDKILSLRHLESEYWDFWCEDLPAEKMAQYLVQESSGTSFFWKAARFVVASLLEQSSNLDEFKRHIRSADSMISEYLSEQDPQATNVLGSPGSGQSTGVWGNSSLDLKFVEDLGYWPLKNGKKEPFSIMNWAKENDDSWVFVVANSSEIENIRPIIAAWFNIAIFGCLARRENDFEKMGYRPIRMVLDELKSLGKLDDLALAGERLRKHRGSLICGYQNNSQIEKVYGRVEAQNLKDVIQNKVIYSVGEGQAQEELSRLLGEREVEEFTANTQHGKHGTSESQGQRFVKKRLVLPSEIGSLAREEAIIKISNYDPIKVKIPYRKFVETAPGLVWEKPPKTSLLEANSNKKKIEKPPENSENTELGIKPAGKIEDILSDPLL